MLYYILCRMITMINMTYMPCSHPGLLWRQRAELHAMHPAGEHHAPRGLLHERPGDDDLLQRGGTERLVEQFFHAQRIQRFIAEIEFGVEALREGLGQGDVVRLVGGEAPDQGAAPHRPAGAARKGPVIMSFYLYIKKNMYISCDMTITILHIMFTTTSHIYIL